MSEWNNVACPVCGFRLQGSPFSGFRCVKCHAYYSAKFIRHVRRANIKHMLQTFNPPEVVVKEEFVVPNVNVQKVIDEAKKHVEMIPLSEIRLHTKTVRKVIKHAKRKDVKEIVKRHQGAKIKIVKKKVVRKKLHKKLVRQKVHTIKHKNLHKKKL